MIANFAPQPLLRINIDRDGGVPALGDAATATGVAIGQMRSMLDDVEGTAVGADDTLSKRIGHGYASFSGAWSGLVTGIRRVDDVRHMVSVLRRNCNVPRAGLLASKWHLLSCAEPPPSPA